MMNFSNPTAAMELLHEVAAQFSERYPEARFEFSEEGVKIPGRVSASPNASPGWAWFWDLDDNEFVVVYLMLDERRPWVSATRDGGEEHRWTQGGAPFGTDWPHLYESSRERVVRTFLESMIGSLAEVYPETEIRWLERIWPEADEVSVPTKKEREFLSFLQEHGPQSDAEILRVAFDGKRRSWHAVRRVLGERRWIASGEREESKLQVITPGGERALERKK